MRVFITGATGFIGSAVVAEFVAAGHDVVGLARSDEGAAALSTAGATALRGHLGDLETLKRGATGADAVIHLAFVHDFTDFRESCETDARAIEAIGTVLAGSDRPFIVTAGIGQYAQGRPIDEHDDPPANYLMPRVSEQTAMALLADGVNASVVRLPQVHDIHKFGLVSYMIDTARAKGVSAYVGDGATHWPACHVLDTARLYRLALESHRRGAKYHAVAEEGVRLRDIAEAVGTKLGVPTVSLAMDEAVSHFGFVGGFAGIDLRATSALTREQLGWQPTGPGMLEDLAQFRG